jgi:hypothetical protein
MPRPTTHGPVPRQEPRLPQLRQFLLGAALAAGYPLLIYPRNRSERAFRPSYHISPRQGGAGAFLGPAPARSLEERDRNHGQSDRDRPRHDELLRRHHGWQPAAGHRKLRRRTDDAVDRRLHRRRTPRRSARQAAGRHQPRKHHLRRQAPDRPPRRRCRGRKGQGPRPLQDRRWRQRRRLGRGEGREVQPLADLGLHPDRR